MVYKVCKAHYDPSKLARINDCSIGQSDSGFESIMVGLSAR